MIYLAIIEDQPSIRKVFHDYLCAQPEFDCVLTAASVEEFLEKADSLENQPGVVLSDIGMPGGMSGIEGLPLIKQRLPEAEVLMISVFTDASRVFQAICAGAVGYLVKNTPLPQLKESILQVVAGGSPMSPGIARHVIQHFQPQKQLGEELTPREQQIVQAIVDGLSYKLVAERLGISLDTVRSHIRQIYRKLQVNSKAEVIAYSLKKG
jgi:DNA-binding NarL/FixJ family response regulator